MINPKELDYLIGWLKDIHKRIMESAIYLNDDLSPEDSRYQYNKLCFQMEELRDVIHFLNNIKEAQGD